MEHHGWSIQSNVKSVSFSTNHWFVSIPSECQIANLCILETWSIHSICGRIYYGLGFAPILRIFPVYSRGSMFAKKSGWWGYWAFDCPYVAYYSKLFWFFIKHVGSNAPPSFLIEHTLYLSVRVCRNSRWLVWLVRKFWQIVTGLSDKKK